MKTKNKEMETAEHIIKCFGGVNNIKKIEKEITRIKVSVDSNSLVDRQNFTDNSYIIGTIKSNECLEIVMNFKIIDDVFRYIEFIKSNNKD